jgi:hypothetical protein
MTQIALGIKLSADWPEARTKLVQSPPGAPVSGRYLRGAVRMEDELVGMLRHRDDLHVTRISAMTTSRMPVFSIFTQAGLDVHGSHGLFYWLRARGKGVVIQTDKAGLVLTWRPDVKNFIALRPVGELNAIADLLDEVAEITLTKWFGFPVVARYCGNLITNKMIDRGWALPPNPWPPNRPFDDETYPEVIITADPLEIPPGKNGNLVRKAINLNADKYSYCTSPVPIGCGEAEFVRTQAARADYYDDQEISFNEALIVALGFRDHHAITYHYMFDGDRLSGFAVTANTTGISHLYYAGTTKASRLSVYFQWKIYLEERCKGSSALNLGGSETESLHTFKARTFPKHELQQTTILQPPYLDPIQETDNFAH